MGSCQHHPIVGKHVGLGGEPANHHRAISGAHVDMGQEAHILMWSLLGAKGGSMSRLGVLGGELRAGCIG